VSQIERKLAAIMFTDIAGYTESMSKSGRKLIKALHLWGFFIYRV